MSRHKYELEAHFIRTYDSKVFEKLLFSASVYMTRSGTSVAAVDADEMKVELEKKIRMLFFMSSIQSQHVQNGFGIAGRENRGKNQDKIAR